MGDEIMIRFRCWSRLLATLFLVFAFFGVNTAQSESASHPLYLGTAGPMHWALGELIVDRFMPVLKEESAGELELKVFPRGAICSEHGCVEQVMLGMIDMATISAGNAGAFGDVFEILNMPYLFSDQQSASKIMEDWLRDELAERAERELGFKVLAITPGGGFRNLVNNRQSVSFPSDLRHLKLRTTKSAVEIELIRSWGGRVVPYDWALLYEGLQAGVVDGMYLQNIFTAAAGLSTIVTHITETQATYSAHIVVMSAARFYALPLAHQEALLAAGRAVEEEADEYYQAWLDRSLPALQGRVEIKSLNAVERQEWERLSLDAWERLKGRFDPAMVKRVLHEQGRQEFLKQLEERRVFE